MPSWNNIQTTDQYQEFRFRRTLRVTLAVFNNPILAQFAIVTPPGTLHDDAYPLMAEERDMASGVVWGWTPDDFPNGSHIVGVAIKSEIAGTPALVTIHA